MEPSASFRIAPSRLRHSAATDGVTEYMRAFAIIYAGYWPVAAGFTTTRILAALPGSGSTAARICAIA
jgi:hypothetical protein